jgi:TP901 family phage tail tape measure protein
LADVNSNININFNTAAALAQLRQLQAGLSKFHQSLAEGNLAAANAQKGLNAQLLQSLGATGKFAASQVKVAGSTLAFTSALEKNKLSLREYYRYTMAAATANTRVMGRAFAQEREIINRARRDRVKALQAQYIQMNKANAGFMDAIRIMPKNLQMASGRFTELGARIQYAAQRQQFLNQLLKQGSTQLLNFGKNTQWAGRQLMVGLTMPLALFGASAAKAFRELEAEIIKFKRVYGTAVTNDAEVNAAVENIRKLATEYTKYGVSVTKTMEMAGTAAAAGFAGAALNTQVETATKLAVLGQVEQQQALETTMSLQNAFGLSSEELAKKIDFLNAVENQTVLSIEDLTIAIPKAAPVIKQLGGNVEDLAFFMTAMKEGGINASEGANALKSGLASLINPSKKAAGFLADLGINVKGIVEANQGDIKATVIGFSQALDTLDPLNRARAIEQMFGKFQFARLSTLFQNVAKDGTQASRALDLAGSTIEELAVLSEREMKKIEDSVGVKFQAAIEQFKQEIMPLGKAFLEALTPVVKFFGNIFEKFNGLSDQTKKVVAVIVGVVAGLGPVLLMTFGLLANGVANVIKFFAMLRGGIAKLNGQTSVMGAGFNYMTQEQIESAAASQQLHQTHTRLIEVFNVEKVSVNNLAASYHALSTQMRTMAAQNPSLFAGGVPGARRAVSKLPPVKKYAEGILSVPGPKGAGDVVPAMLSPGEAVIPTDTTNKYRGLISAMFQDKVPGFMAGRLPGGPGRGIPLSDGPAEVRKAQQAKYRRRDDARQGYNEDHPEAPKGPVFVGMPKTFKEASQSRQILDKISEQVSIGRFGTMPPSNFGTKLQGFKGYSFPERGIGGVYRKPNGKIVVVKPTIDEKTALAEVRMTQIEAARGMIVPKQSIRTMIDPTDPTGQRKFIVIESPYDPRIAAMDGKFSKTDMVKQLVGSTLRGDKDLQQANVSGRIVADVGNAGVMTKASGFRDYAKEMPSMEEQAMINLLGVKGGAKKFFAQETAPLAAEMTPQQYDTAIKTEINRSIPKVERLIRSWDLEPDEQIVYNNLLERLKAGAKVDWAALQPVHARAGNGVVKAIKGIDSGALPPEIREQLAKYSLASMTQEQSMIDDLKRNTQNALIARIAELDLEDPTRGAVVRAAWEGGKAPVPPSMKEQGFSSPRQSSFLNEISNMTPVNVDGVTKYIHDDDMDAFSKDPNGRAKYARTAEQVVDNVLYRMGAKPGPDGYVAGGKFKGRFASRSAFLKDLKSTGKQSGGGLANTSKTVRPFAKEEIEAYNRRVGDPLETKTGKAMLAAGYSPDEVRRSLRENLSHIKQEVTGSTSGSKKMKTGQALYDAEILNKYMNAKGRALSILNNLNKDNILVSKAEEPEFRRAAEFMAKGEHPKNAQERALFAKAVELDQRVVDAQADGRLKNVAAKYLPADLRTPKILQTLLSDPAFQPGKLMNLAAKSADEVFVGAKKQESITDESARTVRKIGNKDAIPMPKNVIPIDAKGRVTSDNLLVRKRQSETITTPSQTRQLMRVRGFDDGDGSVLRNTRPMPTPTVRQGRVAADLRAKGYSQDEIDRVLRKVAKDEAKLARSKSESVTQQARNQKLDDADRRRQTNEARARFKKQQHLSNLNYNQARYYQEALDEDERRKLNNLKQSQRQDAQARKNQIKERRNYRAQKASIASGGAAMALGTAGTGLLMSGNTSGGMALMGASAVAGMAPMFAGMGPVGLITSAAIAAGAGLLLFNKHLENAAKKQAQYVDSISATTNKMDEIGKITDRVGASRAMDEVRKKGSFGAYNDVERAGTGFGDTFLRSEVGKQMVDGFVKEMSANGSAVAAKDFALQLSTYVSDGVLDAAQAVDIADQIGIQLGSRKYTAEIIGDLREIIGPNGEDIANNPLKVRMDIISETSKRSDRVIDAMNKQSSGISLTSGRAEAAQLAALSVNNIAIAKAQADATEFEYRKRIQLLEKELESTQNAEKLLKIKEKIAALEGKLADDMVVANNAVVAQIDKEKKRFKDNIQNTESMKKGNKEEDAYFDSLKSKVKDVYKGTGFESAAGTTLSKLAKLSDKTFNPFDGNKTKGGFTTQAAAQDFEVDMSLLLANKVLNPDQMDTFLLMFQGKLPELSQTLKVGMQRQGAGPTIELLEYFSGFDKKNSAKGVEIATKIINSDKKTFNEVGETMAVLRALDGHEINMEAYITTVGYDGLVDLSKDLKIIEGMPKTIDKAIILDYFVNGNGKGMEGMTESNLQTLFKQWKDFDKLPDVAQKEAISKFKTLYETVFADEASRLAFYSKYAAKATGGDTTATGHLASLMYNAKNADETLVDRVAASTKTYIGENGEVVVNSSGNADSGGGSGAGNDPLAFLAPLAMALKNVRDNAFNALTPVKSLLELLKDKKTQKNAFTLFDGIQHRLLKMGVGQELRDAVASMSAEDFAKVAALPKEKAMFTFEEGKARSKDSISGLGPLGEATDKAIKAKDLGNFDIANATIISDIQNQTKAYAILVGSGLSAAQALEVVADSGQAAAIAAGAIDTSSPAWQTYINNIKTANTDLERQAVLTKAIKANEEFAMYKQMPELVSKMKELGYSTDQIDAVLGDPELAKFLVEDLKDGKLDAKEIADTLNNIEARKIVDIQIALNKGDLKEASDKGRDVVDELFAAQEALIRTGPEAMQLKGNQRQIRDLEGQIAPFQRRIAELNDEIEDGQRAIEESYTRPIEDLNEEINDLNRDLEMNPFFGDRAIKKIQDENTMLSNDLEIINHAADEVNKRYDEQAEALSKVQEINQNILDQQKQQLGLADALTQGDISAAAQAAQDMRATSASQFASGQSDALEQARQNALGSLVGPQSGLTQEQITEKQFQNSQKIYQMETDPRRLEILDKIQLKQDQIYALEEKREGALRKIRDLEDEIWKIEENSIEPLQERIDALNYTNRLLQDSIDKQIEGLKVLGKTRDEWDRINAMLDMDAATKRALAQSEDLAGLLSAAEQLNLTWADILAKMAAYANGIPGAVQNARNAIGGIGADAYVAPQDDVASLAAFEEFLTVVEELDAATAALEDAYDKGQWAQFDSLQRRLAAAQDAYNKTLPVADPGSIGTGGGIGGKYGMLYQADGGFIPKGTDTVPAMLTPGEFVVKKSSVDKYGTEFLHDLNAQRLAKGGVVGQRVGGSGPDAFKPPKRGLGALFDKSIWESTANFFGLPAMAKTGLDIARYGGLEGMLLARVMGKDMKSTPGDNLQTMLNVLPIPVGKLLKPIAKLIPDSLVKVLTKNGVGAKVLAPPSLTSGTAGAVSTATAAAKPKKVMPEEYSLDYDASTALHKIEVKKDNEVAGYLTWDKETGIIENLQVYPKHEGLGIATTMYTRAQTIAPITHSQYRTPAGDAFAHSIGDPVPPLNDGWLPGDWTQNQLDIANARNKAHVATISDESTVPVLSSDTLNAIEIYKANVDKLQKNIKDLEEGTYLSPGTQEPVTGEAATRLIETFKDLQRRSLNDIEIGIKNDVPPGILEQLREYTTYPTVAHGSSQNAMQQISSIRPIGEDQVVYRGLSDMDMAAIVGYKLVPNKNLSMGKDWLDANNEPAFVESSWAAYASRWKENIEELYKKANAENPINTLDYRQTAPFKDFDSGMKIGESWIPEVVKSTTDSLTWAKKIAVTDFTGGGDTGAIAKIFVDKDVLGFSNLMDFGMGGTRADLSAKEQLLAPFTEYVLKEINPLAHKIPAAEGKGFVKSFRNTGDPDVPAGFGPNDRWEGENVSRLIDEYVFEAKRTLPVPTVRMSDQIEYPTFGKPNVVDNQNIPSALALKESGAIGAASMAAKFAAIAQAKAEEERLAAIEKQKVQMVARGGSGTRFALQALSSGGIARGTDIVPALLTPGEFVMSKYAVQSHGADTMRAINNGSSVGDSVYNYSISVNVKSDANPDEIARVVMTQIKGIDSQKLRGNRL